MEEIISHHNHQHKNNKITFKTLKLKTLRQLLFSTAIPSLTNAILELQRIKA